MLPAKKFLFVVLFGGIKVMMIFHEAILVMLHAYGLTHGMRSLECVSKFFSSLEVEKTMLNKQEESFKI